MPHLNRPECPRCSGTGELKTCRHVKNGICFNCWGSGVDFGGLIHQANRELTGLRGRWLRMSRRAKRLAPGSIERLSCEEALLQIEVQGKKALKVYNDLLNERLFWSAPHVKQVD